MTHFSHDYEQGIKDERERILTLIEDRKTMLKDSNTINITAMRIPVSKEAALAVSDAIIWAIKGENND